MISRIDYLSIFLALVVLTSPVLAQKYSIRTASDPIYQAVDGVYFPSIVSVSRLDRVRQTLVREALKKGLCLEMDIDVLDTTPVYFDPVGGVVGVLLTQGDCKDLSEEPDVAPQDPGNIDWGRDGPPRSGDSIVAACNENDRDLACKILATAPCNPDENPRDCGQADPRLIYVLEEPYVVEVEGCDMPDDANCPFWARPFRGDIDPTREQFELKVFCSQHPELCEVDIEFLGRRAPVSRPLNQAEKEEEERRRKACQECKEECRTVYVENNKECLPEPLEECEKRDTEELKNQCAAAAYSDCACTNRPSHDVCVTNCTACPQP